ncbi:MAG: XRE family transcriptional regulator [Rhizomicrobium sp.]
MAKKIPAQKGSGDVFIDLGFSPVEAAELNAKSTLIDAIADTMERRGLNQAQAAKLCATISRHCRKFFAAGWRV